MKNNNHTDDKSVIERGIHNLFYNNKYLAVFSFVAAVVLWVVVVMEFSPETTYRIRSVPVIINIENTTAEKLDLQPYTNKEFKIDVTVEGKRYAINKNELSADDITVTANLNYVDSVGTHSLQLVATKNNKAADFEIISLSSEEVEVYFDLYKEIEVDLKVKDFPKNLIAEGYYSEGAVLSPSTIVVGGAAAQIDLLDRENIYARIDPDELNSVTELKESMTFKSSIDLIDAYGNIINFIELKEPAPTISVPVMKVAEFETKVDFSHTPENYSDFIQGISITPETLSVCAVADHISSLENVIVGTIDFAELTSGKNVFTFSKSDFSKNLKVLDDIDEVAVSVNISDVEQKQIDINENNISFVNIPDKYSISLVEGQSKITGVTILGPAEELENITSGSVYAVANMIGFESETGRNTATVDITINNGKCWAYGTYEIPIDVIAP